MGSTEELDRALGEYLAGKRRIPRKSEVVSVNGETAGERALVISYDEFAPGGWSSPKAHEIVSQMQAGLISKEEALSRLDSQWLADQSAQVREDGRTAEEWADWFAEKAAALAVPGE